MMHIPMQKWRVEAKPERTSVGQKTDLGKPDQTLGDYITRKMDTFYDVYPYESDRKVIPMEDVPLQPPKKTFDEWMDEPYFELNNRTTSRRQWWTDSEIDAAKDAWASARK